MMTLNVRMGHPIQGNTGFCSGILCGGSGVLFKKVIAGRSKSLSFIADGLNMNIRRSISSSSFGPISGISGDGAHSVVSSGTPSEKADAAKEYIDEKEYLVLNEMPFFNQKYGLVVPVSVNCNADDSEMGNTSKSADSHAESSNNTASKPLPLGVATATYYSYNKEPLFDLEPLSNLSWVNHISEDFDYLDEEKKDINHFYLTFFKERFQAIEAECHIKLAEFQVNSEGAQATSQQAELPEKDVSFHGNSEDPELIFKKYSTLELKVKNQYRDEVFNLLLENKRLNSTHSDQKNEQQLRDLQFEIEQLTLSFDEELMFRRLPELMNLLIKADKPSAKDFHEKVSMNQTAICYFR